MAVRLEPTTTPAPPGCERRPAVERYYRWVAGLYVVHEGWFEKALREKALDFLSPAPGEAILEIGCGVGFALREIASRTAPSGVIHGVDLSGEMLRKTRERCEGIPDIYPSLLKCDAACLPYAEESFDGVYLSGVLELYGDDVGVAILSEVKRVLRPGTGRLVLATMTDDGRMSGLLRFYEWARGVIPGVLPCRSVDAGSLAVRAGFEVRRTTRIRLKGLLPIQILLLA